ncbi:hypothetical protein [Candidatus Uabimicrobium amorphum]|uniref:Uncharacterized protein n=1 Tax=Uabimicrobium amorphum TaxID=2596890 RepID=A0A5S9ILI5_UABAM|nr:hypothetical protein [Candidatus Uabimicrobium amorphum]BBM84089.1 hypothetical protein UABAM_02445 [Candidatus Uabimicrobium amorphum]
MRITNFITLLVTILIASTSLYAVGKSDMRKDWVKEKKQARKAFKKAYQEFIEDMPKKKAKKLLEKLGLEEGKEELEDYVKFDKGFGPALDALVAYHEIEVEIPEIEEIIKDDELWELGREVAESIYEEHSWKYQTRDYKSMDMATLYSTYINGSTQINISGDIRKRWNNAAKVQFDAKLYNEQTQDTLKKLRDDTAKEKYVWNSLCAQIRNSEKFEEHFKTKKAKKLGLDYKVVKKARKLALKRCKGYRNDLKSMTDAMFSAINNEKDKELKKELQKESKKLKKELEDLQEILAKFSKKIKKKY